MCERGDARRVRPGRRIRTDDDHDSAIRDTRDAVRGGQDDVGLDQRAAAAVTVGVFARRSDTMKR